MRLTQLNRIDRIILYIIEDLQLITTILEKLKFKVIDRDPLDIHCHNCTIFQKIKVDLYKKYVKVSQKNKIQFFCKIN
jgi:hypothetical protein